jgi:protein-L-isoaspartate(D-aspartate) O-methyltransferase
MNFEQARFNMIEQQILPAEVISPALVTALYAVAREKFVTPSQQMLAYADTRLPLGGGELMLLPSQEARLVSALKLNPTDKVLEVGTGSGYIAAVLGELAAQVSSVERLPELASAARARLGRGKVSVHEGDGLLGLPGDAPFDAILVTGALHDVPKTLLDQLKIGGRLVAIVGVEPTMFVQRITRSAAGFATEVLFETTAPYLVETSSPKFVF